MIRRAVVLGLLALLSVFDAAAQQSVMKEIREDKEVEIAPGQWITVKKTDVFFDETSPAAQRIPNRVAVKKILDEESTELILPWKGKTIRWKGCDIPISLRAWENKLYLITFRRGSDARLRYYAQDDEGFREIRPGDYPKRIATQNLWLKPDRYSIGRDGRKIYELEQAIHIDPEDIYFSHTLTAQVWCQLMTGKEYAEVAIMADPQPLLREYAKKYRPIKLTAIVQRKTEKSSP